MDLWTVLGVWCAMSICLAPLIGRFLRGGSARPADAFDGETDSARLSTGRSSGPRRYWQSAG